MEERKVDNDTIRLLRECDAGIKMGIDSIEQVLEYVKDETLKKVLMECKTEHENMQEELKIHLAQAHDDGKDPNLMAKSMSWMKTNVKLVLNESDATIADLITDGCNMGVKSLKRYLNQYQAADKEAKKIAERLIDSEARLTKNMAEYL